MSVREQFETTIPTAWIYYLTYGEDDTLTVLEKNHIDKVCHGWYDVDSGGNESYFSNHYSLHSRGFNSDMIKSGSVINITYTAIPE